MLHRSEFSPGRILINGVWTIGIVAFALIVMGEANAVSDRRQIIAFGTPGSAPMRQFKRIASEARCRLVDRDVDVRVVDVQEMKQLDGSDAESGIEELKLLRGKDNPAFELVLVGKDGGTKARAVEPEALIAFLEQIDTMPMRREEISRAGGTDLDC